MHEHLFINLVREYRGDGLLNDATLAVRECTDFTALGGRTIVDCTNGSMGRDPELLRRVAIEADVNIVMGSGHYRVPYIDADWMDAHTVDEVADGIVRDLVEGVGDTGSGPASSARSAPTSGSSRPTRSARSGPPRAPTCAPGPRSPRMPRGGRSGWPSSTCSRPRGWLLSG